MIKMIGPKHVLAIFSTAIAVVLSELVFAGSHVATLSFFLLILFVMQLLWVYKEIRRERRPVYFVVVAALAFSGSFLTYKALELRQETVVKQYMRNTVNSSSDTLALATNNNEVIVAVSEELLAKTGYAREELVGRKLDDFVRTGVEEVRVLYQAKQGGFGVAKSKRVEFLGKKGELIRLEMSLIACKLLEQESVLLLLTEP